MSIYFKGVLLSESEYKKLKKEDDDKYKKIISGKRPAPFITDSINVNTTDLEKSLINDVESDKELEDVESNEESDDVEFDKELEDVKSDDVESDDVESNEESENKISKEDIMGLLKDDLQNKLNELNLSSDGNKSELQKRLLVHYNY
ncbi:MAG: hypothetical protein DRG78_09410 [Epsilonproteobacteria bacterium]|nr:MAG: hypothetical protein DRG78_09410 [Campylobacterota bacterium]